MAPLTRAAPKPRACPQPDLADLFGHNGVDSLSSPKRRTITSKSVFFEACARHLTAPAQVEGWKPIIGRSQKWWGRFVRSGIADGLASDAILNGQAPYAPV